MNKFGDGMTALSGLLSLVPGGQPFALGAGALGFLGSMAGQDRSTGYTQPNYGMGGVMGKVEKDEIVQTPDGQMAEVGGGTHASGNDTTIMAPEGTAVYSDAIEIDGESMAERKEKREKRMAKLQKKVEKIGEDMEENMTDSISRQASERKLEFIMADYLKEMMEEQSDMQVQEIISAQEEAAQAPAAPMGEGMPEMGGGEMGAEMGGEMPMMKHGGKMKEYASGGKMKKYPMGGQMYDPERHTPNYLNLGPGQQTAIDMLSPAFQDLQAEGNFGAQTSRFAAGADHTGSDIGGNLLNRAPATGTRMVGRQGSPVDTLPPAMSPSTDVIPQDRLDAWRQSMGITTPGAAGGVEGAPGTGAQLNPWSEAGSLMNIFGPTAITALQRLGDRPNPNYMGGYGADGLRTQGRAFDAAAGTRDRSLGDVDRASAAQRFRNQTGARGIGTQRAMGLATQGQAMDQKQQVRDSYRNHIANLFRERAGMQNQVDQVRMGGAAQADISDRQDRAAFHTNLAQSLTQGARSAQHYGKMQDMSELFAEAQRTGNFNNVINALSAGQFNIGQ